jgi:hypothetical protein
MILPLGFDRLPLMLGRWLARQRHWNAVGERVVLTVDESGDPSLFGRTLHGVIRDVAVDSNGDPARAIVDLDTPLDYAGHYTKRGIASIITTPYLKWHELPRLLATATAVRIIDGDAFEDDQYQKIIGLATMRRVEST